MSYATQPYTTTGICKRDPPPPPKKTSLYSMQLNSFKIAESIYKNSLNLGTDLQKKFIWQKQLLINLVQNPA